MSGEDRPLADVVVLDLADEATVFAGKLLAELGATVARVEDAGGDAIRKRPPFLGNQAGIERSLAHLLFNAGKKSIALDFGKPASTEVVRRLLGQADVVIGPLGEPAWMRGLLDGMRETDDGPGLVRTVFRRGAPDEVATDLVAVAAGGLLGLNGFPEDPPNYPAGQLGYKEASLAAAQGALALVMERRRGGRAREVRLAPRAG